MVRPTDIALVRHGMYDHMSGHLTDEGILQADKAAVRLVEGYRFWGAVILTSPALRAEETTDRIAAKVGEGEGTVVFSHPALQIAGEHPESMRNLKWLAQAVIETSDPLPGYDGRVVIVTHLPLIARIMNLEDVEYGGIHFYEGDGYNPVYSSEFEAPLLGALGQPLN